MTTPLQSETSRRNGALSSGPVTEDGKSASRSNSMTHGLSGAGVVLHADEAAEVARRETAWLDVFRPSNPVEAYLVRQYALESVRIERCQQLERNLRDALILRASDPDSWDEDRRLEAEEIGARLARDPSRAVRRLRQSAQGCEWLASRWESLALILDSRTTWDESQHSLALDLLGTPLPLRNGPSPADPSDGESPGAPQRALALAQVAELRRLRERVLEPRDAEERRAACLGVDLGEGKTQKMLRLIRRYESESQKRLRHAMQLLLNGRLASAPCQPLEPAAPTLIEQPAVSSSEPDSHVHVIPPTPDLKSTGGSGEFPDAVPAAPEPVPATETGPAIGEMDDSSHPLVSLAPRANPARVESLPALPDTPRGNRRWRKEQKRRERARCA